MDEMTPYYEDEFVTLYVGDVREILPQIPKGIAQSSVSSPPYFGLRNYNASGQIGLEPTPADFIAALVSVYDGVRDVLRPDGTVFLNLGDSYSSNGGHADTECNDRRGEYRIGRRPEHEQRNHRYRGLKEKDLMLMPHRTAIALQDAGWWIRQAFPWVKSSAMPESVTDRAGNALEYWFHLSAAKDYFCDMDAVRVGITQSTVQRMNQDIENQNGSTRANGNTRTDRPMKMVLRDRSIATNRNGEGGHLDQTPAGSRNLRNVDLWFTSVEKPYGLVGTGDEITGLHCNPKGFSGEFCTACRRYYHDSRDKAQIKKVDDERFCVCGRSDAWLSHFATFPIDLITPLIKMSTSEKGECRECGSAWERVAQPSEQYAKVLGNGYHDHDADLEKGMQSTRGKNRQNKMRDETGQTCRDYVTTGWQPTCTCNAGDPVPQTIFEPFSGAGTTMIAARKLGRKCIAVELNPDYAEMSVQRYKREIRDVSAVRPVREEYEDLPLFQ